MRHLSQRQTRRVIEQLGIERPLGEVFAYQEPGRLVRYEFHRHSKHLMMIPWQGSLTVETRERLFLCAPGSGIWIAAATPHATSVGQTQAAALFFPASAYGALGGGCHVFGVSPLLGQMARAASGGLKGTRAFRDAFYQVMYSLGQMALDSGSGPTLPRPRSALLGRAVEHLLGHLAEASAQQTARAAGVSERSLRRYFQAELGISLEDYLRRARLMKAMQLLQSESGGFSVLQVALEVGYQNQSAFAAAFRKFAGCSPSAFQRRGQL